MSGSTFGKLFKISTWGESHGAALGVVIDGCPAGVSLSAELIQPYLDRRKPGASEFATKRNEADTVIIMSGVFKGKTTGSPISMMIKNSDSHSPDYDDIKEVYRPSHADYTFEQKYGFRDYRGGGRSSGRETSARVAAGAVAQIILKQLGVDVCAYTKSIGNILIDENSFDKLEIGNNELCMPDKQAYLAAKEYLTQTKEEKDSSGGIIECTVDGLFVGVGEPVFDKLDALIAQAIMSMGAVKGVEFGKGFGVSTLKGSQNNDEFYYDGKVSKRTNNAGGVLGGMSDGSQLVFRAAVKPTASIAQVQKTINTSNENIEISIAGRHDPIIVARAVVVVECMTALVLLDLLMQNMVSKMDSLVKFYNHI